LRVSEEERNGLDWVFEEMHCLDAWKVGKWKVENKSKSKNDEQVSRNEFKSLGCFSMPNVTSLIYSFVQSFEEKGGQDGGITEQKENANAMQKNNQTRSKALVQIHCPDPNPKNHKVSIPMAEVQFQTQPHPNPAIFLNQLPLFPPPAFPSTAGRPSHVLTG
jgi:hypothetical protein